MNAVKGYGEMLLEDAQAAHADVFVGDLEKMLAAAKRLLARINSLVDLAHARTWRPIRERRLRSSIDFHIWSVPYRTEASPPGTPSHAGYSLSTTTNPIATCSLGV